MSTHSDPSPPTATVAGDASMPVARLSLRQMGRYELVDELGRGGMGVVYRAWDPELGRSVALKVLLTGPSASATSRLRFLREARAAARLHHPGIVRVYDIGEHDGNAWFTMPLVVGPTLNHRLRQGPVSSAEAARWVAQVARALHHAHEQGLIHRDVKPANVLLEGGDTPMLMDFGLVRHYDADEAGLTHESQVLGTPAYMSPEQVQGGAESVGPASDQYSLGVVLYELLAGVRPFQDANPAVLLRRILDEAPPPLPPSVPHPLAAVVERAMRQEADRRYPSCAALAEDLERYLRGEAIEGGASLSSAVVRRALRRHRRGLGVAGRVGLAAVGLLGALLLGLRWREARQLDERAAAADARWTALETRLGELYARDRIEDADEQLRDFLAFEGNQRTPALAAAWRGMGALRAAHDDPEGALDAFANAWLLAEARGDQIEILLAMAEVLRARSMWAPLGAVLDSLRALDAPANEAITAWQRDLALVRGDVEAALAGTADPVDRAVIDAITRATPTPHRATIAARVDLDADGRDELLLLHEETSDLQIVDTTSPALPRRAVLTGLVPPGPRRVIAAPAAAPLPALLLLGWQDTTAFAWDGAGLRELFRLDDAVIDLASGDLDGDGAVEHYIGTHLDVMRLDPDGGAVRVSSASREHRANRVGAPALEVADLNSDGHPELIVGTSTWTGYDVRSLESGPQGLTVATRRRVGQVDALAPLRLASGPAVAVLKSKDPREITNRQVFRPDELEGEARGIHVLVRTPQGFDRRALLPLPEPPPLPGAPSPSRPLGPVYTLLSGDLNSDGLDDLIVGYDARWTVVFVQHADGRFTELQLPGVYPLALAQADEDPATEIIAMQADAERRVWVLAAGEQRAPSPTMQVAAAHARPSGLPSDLASAWDRAEALVAIGRLRAAAERLEVLAGMAQDAQVGAAGRMRAGELYAANGESGRASQMFREAARVPGQEAPALEAALASALEDVDLSRALEAGEARLALPSPPVGLEAQVRELARAAARPVHEFDLREEIDPRWHVLTPVGVSSRAGVGLELLSAERAVLMELPVQWDGGPFRVELDLELARLDWGGLIGLELGPPDGWTGNHDLWLASGGGAAVYEQALHCSHWIPAFRVALRDGALTGRPLSLAQEVDPVRGRASCSLGGAGDLDGRRVSSSLGRLPRPGRLVLRIAGNAAYDSQATAILHSLRLRGLEPISEPATPAQLANRLIALDRSAEALEALRSQTGAVAGLARARALEGLGRRAEAHAEMHAALAADPQLGGQLGRVIRGALNVFERELREHFGARFALLLWEHSSEILEMHAADPPAQELLTHYFAGVEGIDPAGLADDEARVELARILSLRAAAWRRAGRTGAAVQDLDRADAIAEAVEARARQEAAQVAAARLRAVLSRERALLLLSRGEDEAAVAELLRGLTRSPAPFVFADLVVANSDFDRLQTRPEWAQIVAARRVWP